MDSPLRRRWLKNNERTIGGGRNVGRAGQMRVGWRLSPFYDVMPRASLAAERRLHLGVGPEGKIATLDNAFAFRHIDDVSTQALRKLIP
jgi:hypothetical protein